MSDSIDALRRYYEAHAAHRKAEEDLDEATKAAWPVGTPVISNKFAGSKNGKQIHGTIAGHGTRYNDPGSVLVKNTKTGKSHRAWPWVEYHGVKQVIAV